MRVLPRRSGVLVPFLLCLIGTAVWGQAVSQVVFLPQTYYVGDVVEARVLIRSSANLDLAPPATLPATDWVDIRSVTIVQRADGYEVRIVFQPFFVGTRQLPPIDLQAITISDLSPVVNSLAPEEGDLQLRPIRDQLLLPGTQILIAVMILGLVGTPILVITTSGWLSRTIGRLRARYRENRPYRMLQRGLKQLQAEMHQVDGKRYYIRLLDLTREYLGGRFSPSFRSATTGELDVQLRRVGIPPAARGRLVELFQFGDLVKFANRRITVADRTRHLEEVREVTAQLQRNTSEEDDDVGA